MKFFSEFKEFIMRGNIMDMAVGVVVGTAFSAIVTSLVNDIIMPAVSLLTGTVNIASLAVTVPNPLDLDETLISLNYGNFLQQVINFLIIAFSIFCVVKAMNAAKAKLFKAASQKKEEQNDLPPTQEQLLAEIRDLLKEQNNSQSK